GRSCRVGVTEPVSRHRSRMGAGPRDAVARGPRQSRACPAGVRSANARLTCGWAARDKAGILGDRSGSGDGQTRPRSRMVTGRESQLPFYSCATSFSESEGAWPRGHHSMPAESAFVHLHVHSSYSLLEGALTITRLAELAKNDRQPALALTDTDNMFGALEFSEKVAGFGIQPIVGCTMAVDFGDLENRNIEHVWPHLVLLAAD